MQFKITGLDGFMVLTPVRCRLLQAMMRLQKPTGIRELARILDRDVEQVDTDVTALVSVGVINRAEDDKVKFPYDQIRVNFTIKAA